MPSTTYNGAQITAWRVSYDPPSGEGVLSMNYMAIRTEIDGTVTSLPNAARLSSLILRFMGSVVVSALLASAEMMIAGQEGLNLRGGDQILL